MKEEGFLNGAFNKIKDGTVEARWLMNQSGFNFADTDVASATQRACIAFAMAVETKNEKLIEEAIEAQTLGDLKAVIEKLEK